MNSDTCVLSLYNLHSNYLLSSMDFHSNLIPFYRVLEGDLFSRFKKATEH